VTFNVSVFDEFLFDRVKPVPDDFCPRYKSAGSPRVISIL